MKTAQPLPSAKALQLAPPGAGLPKLELSIARLIFDFSQSLSTPTKTARLIRQEQAASLTLLESVSPVQASERILIKRLRGLEDSSRYWSMFMTLDHLRIVNTQVASVIGQLRAGTRPARPVSTADVKPSLDVNSSVIAAFNASCTALEQAVQDDDDLRTTTRFAHPWFGPLDARGWHFMAGFHLRLHRRQLERIRTALRLAARGD
jgi:hypothetical protein